MGELALLSACSQTPSFQEGEKYAPEVFPPFRRRPLVTAARATEMGPFVGAKVRICVPGAVSPQYRGHRGIPHTSAFFATEANRR